MRGRTVGFVGVLAIALLLVTGAGAGTTTPTRIDLSSMAKIHQYLRAQGVDPQTVVIQRGQRNYAGPRCPGKGWNCTTATRVLQAGGQNTFECPVPAYPTDTQTCVDTQEGPGRNEFRCVEKTTANPGPSGAVQECSVTQFGAETNIAVIDQLIDQSGDPEQDATQRAFVDQTASSKNEAHISQTVRQFTNVANTLSTQRQDAHQRAEVHQTATGTVGNFAHVHQTQDQQEKGAAETQTQNTTPSQANDCAAPAPTAPNECAFVQQTTDDGINNGHIHHALFEDMATSVKPTTPQQQGIDADSSGAVSGLEGQFEQSAGAQGKNNQHGNQTKHLHVSAPAGSALPNQFDQARCCGVSATGGTSGESQVVQHADVSAPPGANQTINLRGESHVTTAGGGSPVITSPTSPSGGAHCHVTQHGSVNEDSSGGSASDQGPFCEIVLITICNEGACTTGPEGDSLVTLIPTTPTNGLPLSADIFGEPSDYTGPVFPLP